MMVYHASHSPTVSLFDVMGAHGQETTMRVVANRAGVSPSLLLVHIQSFRGERVTMIRDLIYHIPVEVPTVLADTLLTRGFSCCCCKLLPTIIQSKDIWPPLPTAMLPQKDFGVHCTRLYSRRRMFQLLPLRLLPSCLRTVLTAPTETRSPRMHLTHLLLPAKLVPARLCIGKRYHPFLTSYRRRVMNNGGTESMLRQGWFALIPSTRIPCP